MPSAETIETLVATRRTKLAHDQIIAYLRAHGRSPAVVFQACEWFRRLGLYRDGFALVAADGSPLRSYATRSIHGRRLLWAARFLNLLGAGRFALNIARRLRPSYADEYLIMGNLFLTNFEYAAALEHFQAMESAPGELRDYTRRLAKISLADAAAGAQNWDLAFQSIDDVLSRSTEPLMIGIAHQARGEYLVRTGKLRRAYAELKRAEKNIPSSDRTPDRGVLCKWMGYVVAKSGQTAMSRSYFAEAKQILMNPDVPPEAWLDLFRLQHEVGLFTNSEYQRLTHFPGLAHGFVAALPSRKPIRLGADHSEIHIDFDRNEFSHSGSRYLGINSELRLLGFLRLVEGWGLSIERAKCVLWPDEAHAYAMLEGRLHQLVLRLRRHYGFSVEINNAVIRLDCKQFSRVSVDDGFGDVRPSFLAAKPRFSGSEVSEYYCISKTQRSLYLRQWIDKEWIEQHGRAARSRYVSLSLSASSRTSFR